jgi:hypothetical protein
MHFGLGDQSPSPKIDFAANRSDLTDDPSPR